MVDMSGSCPNCNAEELGLIKHYKCGSHIYNHKFIQSDACKLRVAEQRIAELIADYDQKIEVVLGERDNWNNLYDEARKRIAELEKDHDMAWKRIDELESHNDMLRSAQHAATIVQAEASDRIRALEAQCKQANINQLNAHDVACKLQDNAATLNLRIAELESERNDERAWRLELQLVADHRNTIIDEQAKQIADIEQKLKIPHPDRDCLNEANELLAAKEKKIAKLEKDRNEFKDLANERYHRMESMSSQISVLRSEMVVCQKQLTEACNERDIIKHSLRKSEQRVQWLDGEMVRCKEFYEEHMRIADEHVTAAQKDRDHWHSMYDEQCNLNEQCFKHLQSGKEWWVVRRVNDCIPFAFDNEQQAINYAADPLSMGDRNPIHCREVVLGDELMAKLMGHDEVEPPKPKPFHWWDYQVSNTPPRPETYTGGAMRFCAEDKAELKTDKPEQWNMFRSGNYVVMHPGEAREGEHPLDTSKNFMITCTVERVNPPFRPTIHELGEEWFSVDAVQILDYDWEYAGWVDPLKPWEVDRVAPCTGSCTTIDAVSLKDAHGNDMLTWAGLLKHCEVLDSEIARLRQRMNRQNGVIASRQVESEHLRDRCESYLRQIESLKKCLLAKCEKVADLKDSQHRLKREFEYALNCVDRVFQPGGQPEPPLLPDFLRFGESKFQGVVKLAEEYIRIEAERRTMIELLRDIRRQYETTWCVVHGAKPCVDEPMYQRIKEVVQ
jgi:hypothetical protein